MFAAARAVMLAAAPIVLGAVAGCSEPPAAPAAPLPGRAHRFGVLRDLVLYPQRGGHGGPFFLDRFETTNLDWHAYVSARHLLPTRGVRRGWDGQWAPPDALLARPVTGVDLVEARAYARWRLCRLPRQDEWEYAATSGGEYRFPWGDRAEDSWANTKALGLQRTTPVGTFESGRQPSGPYDLVGNVAEWTETIPALRPAAPGPWFGGLPAMDAGDATAGPAQGAGDATTAAADGDGAVLPPSNRLDPELTLAIVLVAGVPGLRPWRLPGVPVPAAWLVAAASEHLPRHVLGGHFLSETRQFVSPRLPPPQERMPVAYGEMLGVRLAADPLQLLVAMLEDAAPLDDEGARLLRRFLARTRDVLRPALQGALARVPATARGPLAALVRAELGG